MRLFRWRTKIVFCVVAGAALGAEPDFKRPSAPRTFFPKRYIAHMGVKLIAGANCPARLLVNQPPLRHDTPTVGQTLVTYYDNSHLALARVEGDGSTSIQKFFPHPAAGSTPLVAPVISRDQKRVYWPVENEISVFDASTLNSLGRRVVALNGNFTDGVVDSANTFYFGFNFTDPKFSPVLISFKEGGELAYLSWNEQAPYYTGATMTAPVIHTRSQYIYVGIYGANFLPTVVAIDPKTRQIVWEKILSDQDANLVEGKIITSLSARDSELVATVKVNATPTTAEYHLFAMTPEGEPLAPLKDKWTATVEIGPESRP